MAILDIKQQLADYRGVLGWDANAGKWPAIEIELFIKEHPIPVRKPKLTEIATISTKDPMSGHEISVQAIYFGAPDILQLQLSGWIITPFSGGNWSPKDKSGAALSLGNITYGELINAFIEGRMDVSATGLVNRKDPDYYISPYGHKYEKPIIAQFDMQYSPTPKKQPFTMTLYLEN